MQFNLADDLGEAPELPANLAGFLEWPEGASDKQTNAQHPPASSTMSPPIPPKRERESEWHHSTTAGRAQPKTSTAPLARPVVAGRAQPRCNTTLDLVEFPPD